MSLTSYERTVLRDLLAPARRNDSLVDAIAAMLRGLGNGGRGPVSGGRGLTAGTLLKIVDDYEDGDISEYDNNTGSYSTTTNTVFNGSHALTTASNNEEIWSTSGLDNYPSAGDVFSLRVYFTASDVGQGVRFAVQSESPSSNYYQIEWHPDNSEWAIRKDGGTVLKSHSSDPPPIDEWQKWVGHWGANGNITFTAYQQNGTKIMSITGNDTTYLSGGIGYSTGPQSNSSQRLMDYFIIES